MLAIVFALEHTQYYTLGATGVTVFTDNTPLAGLNMKDMSDIKTQRLFRMFDRIAYFNVEIIHILGDQNQEADCLCTSNFNRNLVSTRRVAMTRTRSGNRPQPSDLQKAARKI